jgi:hypothetical protein
LETSYQISGDFFDLIFQTSLHIFEIKKYFSSFKILGKRKVFTFRINSSVISYQINYSHSLIAFLSLDSVFLSICNCNSEEKLKLINHHFTKTNCFPIAGLDLLITGGDDNILIWTLPDFRLRNNILAHSSPIKSIYFSSIFHFLVSIDEDLQLCISSTLSDKFIKSFSLFSAKFNSTDLCFELRNYFDIIIINGKASSNWF